MSRSFQRPLSPVSPSRGQPIRSDAAHAVSTNTLPADIDAAAARLNAALVKLHRERKDHLGVAESGLYEHYDYLLGQDAFVRAREIAIAKAIRDELPRFDRYVVLRAGLGEVAFLLVLAGLTVTAFEGEAKRHAALEAGHRMLREFDPGAARRIALRAEIVPEAPLGPDRLIGIATGLVTFPGGEDEGAELARQLRMFDALLIYPRAFLRIRETGDEQRQAIIAIRNAGFSQTRELPDIQLVFFEKAAAQAHYGEPPAASSL